MANARGMSTGSVNFTINARGLERMIAEAPAAATRALAEAFLEEGHSILAAAKAIVPLDTGALMRTGRVIVVSKPGGHTTMSIRFGNSDAVHYAVIQHEDLSFRHLPGRTAKYLKIPFDAAVPHVGARINKKLSATLLKMGYMP